MSTMKLAMPLLAIAFLSACSMPGSSSVEVDSAGNVSVDGPGGSVKVDANGQASVNGAGGSVNANTGGNTVTTTGGTVGSDTSSAQPVKTAPVEVKNVEIIFDASGSMNQAVGGQPKITIAKTAMSNIVDGMDAATVKTGIIAYGHIGSSNEADKVASCNGIEEIYYFGDVNKSVMKSKVNALPAKGYTPITKSLEKAKDTLVKQSGASKRILLISDGEETCGGDPIAMAKVVKAAGICIDVIGFDVSGATEQQLRNIASEACGTYKGVKNASDFDIVVKDDFLHVRSGDNSVILSKDGSMETTSGNTTIKSDGQGNAKLNVGGKDLNVKDGKPSGSMIPSVPGL